MDNSYPYPCLHGLRQLTGFHVTKNGCFTSVSGGPYLPFFDSLYTVIIPFFSNLSILFSDFYIYSEFSDKFQLLSTASQRTAILLFPPYVQVNSTSSPIFTCRNKPKCVRQLCAAMTRLSRYAEPLYLHGEILSLS